MQVHYRDELVIETKVYVPGRWTDLKIRAEISSQVEKDPLIVQEITRLTPDKLNFYLDISKLLPGTYILQVSLIKEEKILSSVSRALNIRKFPAPTDKPKVTIDENNSLVVDGKPFFPIMSWLTPARGFKEISELGFNTVVGPHSPAGDPFLAENTKAYLDAAARANLKVMSTVVSYSPGPNWGPATHTWQKSELEQMILKFKSHPALLGWFTGDEIFLYASVQQMDELYKTIRENDPDHPVYINLMHQEIGHFEGVTTVSDILSFCWYPIPDKPIASYIGLLRRLRNRVADRKPVWVWLQLYMGGERSRDPTPQELRCITYLVIVHGATGIGYFIYCSAGISQENKDALRKINLEIKELTPVILSPPTEQTITARRVQGKGRVNILLKEYNGKKYLFAVNIEDAPVEVKFDLSSTVFNTSEVNVLFEERRIKISDKSFTDSFTGYGVHIYEIN